MSGYPAGQTDLPSVFFVEDDRKARFLLKKMLERTRKVVCTAGAGEALSALSERFGEGPPDLFLLDIRLPCR